MTSKERDIGRRSRLEKVETKIRSKVFDSEWVESETTPFIETNLSLVALLFVSTIHSFAFIDLVDRAPRPTTHYEASVFSDFSLDLSTAPGYTVGEIHNADTWNILLLSILTGCIFIIAVLAVKRWTSYISKEHHVGTFFICSILYLASLIIVLEIGPGANYYPQPSFEYAEKAINMSKLDSVYSNPRGFSRFAKFEFLFVLAVQSFLIAAVSTIYTKEIIPPKINERGGEYLQFYIDLSWRYTQVVLSIGIAVAVGIGIPVFLNSTLFGRFGVLDVSFVVLTTLGAILFFLLLKLYFTGQEAIENDHLEGVDQKNP